MSFIKLTKKDCGDPILINTHRIVAVYPVDDKNKHKGNTILTISDSVKTSANKYWHCYVEESTKDIAYKLEMCDYTVY